MQEILEEFEDKYGHLKEDGAYDELYDLFRNFLYQACIRYAEGIVPYKHGEKANFTDTYKLAWNLCIDSIKSKIKEDAQSITS